MSVSDVSGKAIANLATEELSHPAPVFHGDTLFAETEVLEKRESRSKPDRGNGQGAHPGAQSGTACSSPSSSVWCSSLRGPNKALDGLWWRLDAPEATRGNRRCTTSTHPARALSHAQPYSPQSRQSLRRVPGAIREACDELTALVSAHSVCVLTV